MYMRQTKRKFVALSTALAMALVLVASLVPTTVLHADSTEKYIHADGTIDDQWDDAIANIPGTSEYTSIEKGEGNTIIFTDLIINGGEWSGISFYSNDAWTFIFMGTNKMNMIIPDSGGDLTVSVGDNSTVVLDKVVGGFSLAEGTTADKDITNASMDAPVENVTLSGPSGGGGDDPSPAPDPDPTPTPDPTPSSDVTTITNGSSATLSQASDGTVSFRIEKDLAYFTNGGKLYIDNQEVPTDMYTATQGSTIITLAKEYASKLADGVEHAVKVVFNDGETVEAKITVNAASSDASTATSSTATAASTSTSTTTKAAAAKTADALPYAGLALVFVGASAIGVIAFRRKNS